ncbi:MAG: imidazole glycerol phosphate synthase subunit HisF [uncultured bacterium]|nr:MAG: imidazole glycerol phosphate synthase subunit HisF [uncultured bacterium]
MEPLKNIIIPAIDIIGGKCVRLTKGDYNRIKEYSQSPISVAKQFEEEGAKFLHVIDLDGAKKGETVNLETILAIAKNTNLELQVGGGIRTFESAETLLNNGVAKVIIGTSALEDKRLLKRLITTFGENRIIVSIDVRKGKIATRGWLNESDMGLKVFLESVKEAGVKTIIVTDIEKDGMMNGPNFAMINEFSGNGLNVIVAGGVSSQKDIALLRKNNLAGIIIGKALYEGTVTIQEAQNDLARRIIPCMDMKDGRVVKGTCFKELKDAGDAVELGKLYSDMGADELVFLDISATLENRNTLCGLVEKIAKTINIPFTVGGGVRTVEDIRRLLNAGADKVSIGSAAVKNMDLVREASRTFGNQCIVISVDAKKAENGWKLYIKGGTEETNLEAIEFSRMMEECGAGELLVNSLDRDGTKKGFDIELLKKITDTVKIPVIASSGAGCLQDFLDVLDKAKVDAVLAAGVFHYGDIKIQELKNYLWENNINVNI